MQCFKFVMCTALGFVSSGLNRWFN